MSLSTALSDNNVVVEVMPNEHVATASLKPSSLREEDDTTDIGSGETSGDEGSSSSSGAECRRCRFGITALETIPATPKAGSAISVRSPPGLSRSALRRERDSVGCAGQGQPCRSPPGLSRSALRLERDVLGCASQVQSCRFGVNSLVTVPSTQKVVSPSKRAMRQAFEARMREERDAHRAAARALPDATTASPSPPSVGDGVALTLGSCGNPITPPQCVAGRRAAHKAFIAKALKLHGSVAAEATADGAEPATPGKTAVFDNVAPAIALHWSSDVPLKKAMSNFLLCQGSSSNAAAR